MCGKLTSMGHECSYINPLVKSSVFYDPETGNVSDENGNLIGRGEPMFVNDEIKLIDVSPINDPLISK